MSEELESRAKAQEHIEGLDGLTRSHTCGQLTAADIGSEVCLMGWVQFRRDHGGLIFIDLRDRYGLTQVVFTPEESAEAHAKAHVLRSEYVLAACGRVRARPEGMTNPGMVTGEIEVVVTSWKLLAVAKVPPFEVDDRSDPGENIRLAHRYLDLRRPRMSANMVLRAKAAASARRYLDSLGFLDMETPMLTKSTPEGARDFLVPSRLNPGEFYALPQSPQLFKQLFMVSGLDRYYQITRCFRDEDLRADRQPEFTQIDIEMSFAEEEQIMGMAEGLIRTVVSEAMGRQLPDPFPRMSYAEAMRDYGVDKPDVRFGLKLVELTDIVRGGNFKVFATSPLVKAFRVAGGAELSRKEIDDYTEFVKIYGALGLAWIKVKGSEWQSPIAKFLSDDEKKGIAERLGMVDGDIVFFQAGDPGMVNAALGNLRLKLGARMGLIDEDALAPLWVTDFPLFEYDPEEKRYVAMHHPFTAPKAGHVERLADAPDTAVARAYDMVLNGSEIGGGSVRINNAALQATMFKALGITDEEAASKFGWFMEAMEYGAPPHGGIAFGLDRVVMLLAKAQTIRDVIAFPKTQKGTCLLTQAPGEVAPKQLRELGIRLRESAKPKE